MPHAHSGASCQALCLFGSQCPYEDALWTAISLNTVTLHKLGPSDSPVKECSSQLTSGARPDLAQPWTEM